VDTEVKVMRDIMISEICKKMSRQKNIFFVSGDFGAPPLDRLRTKFKDRFLNIGIAEQNLINVSVGLALESFIVYTYGIIPFLTMRGYEQIKNNISLMAQIREMNINLIGVGTGLSYDISAPSHHAIEDICIMRVLPNFVIFSPSDWVLVDRFVDFSINLRMPKYIRLDGKPLPRIYKQDQKIDLEAGFYELVKGKKVCIVSTGYMTHKALKAAEKLCKSKLNVGVIDIFFLKPINSDLLYKTLKKYEYIVTLEEGFINKGGLDGLVLDILNSKNSNIKLKKIGFEDKYVFDVGGRDYLHKLHGLDEESIACVVKERISSK